jgi:hypothetical protein
MEKDIVLRHYLLGLAKMELIEPDIAMNTSIITNWLQYLRL